MTSQSEKEAAEFLARAVDEYGPLDRRTVEYYAEHTRSQGHSRLGHGLRAVADEMRPGEKVAGAAKPEKRRRW